MVSTILVSALVALSVIQISQTALPPNYQSLSAQQKQDAIWAEVVKNPYPLNALPTESASIFSLISILIPSYLTQAFTWVSDEMIQGRQKLIHTYGTAAKISFNIDSRSIYTGIFRPGNYSGIIRSSVGAIDPTNFIPGVAVKVLLDGQPSANMFTLFSLDGQKENFNYFANSFVTTIPDPQSLPLKILSRVFALGLLALPGGASERPESENNSPVYQHAQINEHPAAVYAPYKVTYIPNPALGWDPADRTDFRAKLAEVPAGVKLWDIAVRRTKTSADEVIGEVILQSEFVASPYQDQTLYFQHPSRRWKA
jgi:hypothetical protein